MKIAVISDIHGNMEAVDAVMKDIEKKECDKIFVLGDYALAGPEPKYAVDYFMVKDNDPRYVMIQGNTDSMIVNYSKSIYQQIKEHAPIMAEALTQEAETLNLSEKSFLRNLPIQKEITLEGVKFLLVHGSPRRNNEDILPDTPIEKVEEMLVNTDADVILCGHTHIPCGFQTASKKTVVNAGSIGRSFFVQKQGEKPKACYLLITVSDGECLFEHQFVDYDNEKSADKIAKRSFEGAERLSQTLINPEMRHF